MIKEGPIDGLGITNLPEIFLDDRGEFGRLFDINYTPETVVQANYSFTKTKGTLRGFHLQSKPHEETKNIIPLRGAIYDVVIDLRKESETFLNFTSVNLNEQSRQMLTVPQGCAHAFQTTEDCTTIIYFNSCAYNSSAEVNISPLSYGLKALWPLPVSHISSKDAGGKSLVYFI